MKFRKKLILAGLSILSLLITAVSTTFAWFSLNDAAWIDDFELEIYSTDQLLVRHETGQFKQLLSANDMVKAINDSRVFDTIESLDDIKLSSVNSVDGESFYRIIHSYDSMNKKTIEWRMAEPNNYLDFKLIFRVDSADVKEGEVHPKYYLTISDDEVQEGVKQTSFTSENQTIRLVNTLVTPGKEYHMDETITVNPVNAMRLSIKGDPEGPNSKVDYIYELSDELDLGSYAITSKILSYLEIDDSKYKSYLNAAYTYYNSINNDILFPLGYVSGGYDEDSLKSAADEIKTLLDKTRYNFNDPLGTFTFDEKTGSYNDLSITIRLWLEGYDADNLIGLDASRIKCLFSFKLEEVPVDA